MEFLKTDLEGVLEVRPIVRPDDRGSFTKLFQKSVLAENGIEGNWSEILSSRSHPNVVRGMHFQRPPHAQGKLVYCIEGEVEDVAFDIRKGSPTYGKFQSWRLSAKEMNAVWLPQGMAHGFVAITEATLVYLADGGEFNAEADGSIRWDSIGYEWPVSDPILSDKDNNAPEWSSFDSPFTWEAK